MKEWLRLHLILRLGGYPSAEAAINAVESAKERKKLLTLAVKKHFNTVGPDDILHVRNNEWMSEGKPITKAERDRLIAEADRFIDSHLWKVLQADVKYQANRAMYLKAKTDEDITAGKLWVYTLDAFNTRLKSLRAGQGILNTKAE